MENIVSGSYNVRVIEKHRKSKDKNGEYFVRYYNSQMGRHHYISDGDAIAWDLYDCNTRKIKTIYKTISSKTNSKKYYISHKFPTNTRAKGNGSIDHFLLLTNGEVLATWVVGYGYLKVNDWEYENEAFEY